MSPVAPPSPPLPRVVDEQDRDSDAPLLRTGDRLDRAEFFRRADAMTRRQGQVWAERLEGVVFVTPSIHADNHGEPQFSVLSLLGLYRSQTPGVRGSGPVTVMLGEDNDPEPDACLYVPAELGGRVRKDVAGYEGYIEGPPELCVEIAHTSAAKDLLLMRKIYGEAGVGEYLVWLRPSGRVAAFRHDGDSLAESELEDGVFRSEQFPGLILDFEALNRDDLFGAMNAVRAGLESPEHAAFVAELESRRPER